MSDNNSPGRTPANRLARETSPYLLQHADNPVHWQPWDDTALATAARENKPILLSIGYSSCHWCHVMARESFSNAELAAAMNASFVCIKVDREERPDLDQIYQFAHQMLTQQPGGWPLTMFLTPDRQIPFFGGTYFPDEARHGMPALGDILSRVLEFYTEHRDDIEQQSQAIIDVFRQTDPRAPGELPLSKLPVDAARQALLSEFDARYGGFGGAPKFPTPGNLTRLMRHWHASSASPEPDLQSLFMATRTLQAMATGGLYDHVGGGFFRYCVDVNWQIPHFEKMLCDNALLLTLYAQASRATGEKLFWRIANETADFLLREFQDERGGFYSALDAEVDGVEGKSYVWSEDDFNAATGDYAEAAGRHFGLKGPANFHDKWHLTTQTHDDNVTDLDDATLGEIRARLFAARESRPGPFRDEKILTSWNALTLRALAISSRHLEREDLADHAAKLIDFLVEQLMQDDRLLASYAGGHARFNGYLDDYAFLLDGLLEMLQTRFAPADLTLATTLADTLLEHFNDVVDGGFFFTSDDHEDLIHRMKPIADSALPSGSGYAARGLLRLGYLLGDTRYLQVAETTLRMGFEPMSHAPHAHAAMLDALEEQLNPPQVIVIRASADQRDRWLSPTKSYSPRRQVYFIGDEVADLPEALKDKTPQAGGVAYVCVGSRCEAPIDSPQALLTRLSLDIDSPPTT
ncbi:MAG: thioredoxin domain-containing protein [Gammaproteobacteria bacterium]